MTDDTIDTSAAADETPVPNCPKCQGDMWDNRVGKRNPKAPDFKCKDKGCDGVIWPPRDASFAAAGAAGGAPAATSAPAEGEPACPVCGGRMWDDRASKRNPRAPDFKCRNKPKFQGGEGCQGVIWPPREGEAARSYAPAAPRASTPRPPSTRAPVAPPPDTDPFRDFSDDEIPF
jgi:hypothetical protein